MLRSRVVAGVALCALLTVVSCSGGESGDENPSGGGGGEDNSLLVWTTEDIEDRVTAQKTIMDAWASQNGATVKLVPVAGDQLTTVLTSAAAANELPDAIAALSLNGVNQLRTDDLLDSDAASEIVNGLGANTFVKRSLELTSADGKQLAVPSDGWAQMQMFYRTDLFKAAGLAEPKTYDDIKKAAQALNKEKTAGIVAATAPSDSFTQQTFEWVALANQCQLVDNSGNVTLNSQQCQQSFDFYGNLMKDDSVPGNQDADTTRATYFAGDAAMVIWSSFLLDELAGLRKDALPTCPKCKDDPKWLAKNSGVVTTLQGPSGPAPAAFGEIVSWNILQDASPKAKDLVTYMMGDGYVDWLKIAPEGKVPTRTGTSGNPQEYIEAWNKMEAGVDTKEVLSAIYPPEVLKAVADSPGSFERWGISQGQGALAAAVGGQFVVPQALAKMINSNASAADATAEAQKKAEQVKTDLGG